MSGFYPQAAIGQSATTLTTILTTTGTYYSGPLTVPAPDPSLTVDPCGYAHLLFSASKGQHVSGLLTSQRTISFLVMSDSVRKNWSYDGRPVLGGAANSVTPCHNVPDGTLISRFGIASYSFSFVFPTSEMYWFWFLNWSSTPIDVNFDMLGSPTVLTSTTVFGGSESITSFSTVSTTALPTTGAQIAGLVSFSNLAMIGMAATVAVVASALVFARRRKTSPAVSTFEAEHAPTSRFQKSVTLSHPIISTGYADLDGTLEGGVPEGFAVVVVSPSYDERDLLLRKIIETALSSGRSAFYISNDIGRIQDLVSRYPNGFYAFSSQADKIPGHSRSLTKIPGIENLSDANISLSLSLKDVMAKEKATSSIMILDILSDILLRHKAITTRRWLLDFIGKRKAEGFTIIATLNPLTTTREETQTVVDSFDGVVEIFERSLLERSRRFLVVKKMYGRRYSENELLLDKDKLF